MGARLRSLALAAAVAAASVSVPAATGGAVACASEGPSAALVVDTGARVLDLCVQLDAAQVSGLRLIELAAAQHGLSYGFGLGGQAVCRLDGVGPTGNDCFAEYPAYWGYWHGDGRGGWTWASAGAGSYRVGDGDVEGWVWGTGDSGATHRKPPAVAIDDICVPAAPPSPEPTRDPKPSPAPPPSPDPSSSPADVATPGNVTSSPGASEVGDRPREQDRTRSSTRTPSPSRSEGSTSSSAEAEVLALGTRPPSDGGPPAGLLVAGVLALLLGTGGWLRLRSRAKDAA